MSFFAKLFKQKPPPDFILHGIRFTTPTDQPLTCDDNIYALIDFESAHPCQIWMMDTIDGCLEGAPSGYDSSEAFPPGRHEVERHFGFYNIDPELHPEGIPVKGARIVVQNCDDGATLFDSVIPTDYLFRPFNSEDNARRQAADKDNLQIEFVSARYNGHYVSAGDSITVGADMAVRIHTRCNEGVGFYCVPRTDLSFGYDGYLEPLDGVLDLNFTMKDTGHIRGFAIVARNRYNMEIGELLVDFPLTVEDWRDDGIGKAIRFEFDGIYRPEENGEFPHLPPNSRLAYHDTAALFIQLEHQTQHGVFWRVFEVIDGEVGEMLMQSALYTPEEQGETWLELDWSAHADGEARQISGFYLQLCNAADEILAEEVADYPLSILP